MSRSVCVLFSLILSLGFLTAGSAQASTVKRRLVAVTCGFEVGRQTVVLSETRTRIVDDNPGETPPRRVSYTYQEFGDPSERFINCYKIYNDGKVAPYVSNLRKFGTEVAALLKIDQISGREALGKLQAAQDKLGQTTATLVKTAQCECKSFYLTCDVRIDRASAGRTDENPVPLFRDYVLGKNRSDAFGNGSLPMGTIDRCKAEAREIQGAL